jgi:Two component regulator propeller
MWVTQNTSLRGVKNVQGQKSTGRSACASVGVMARRAIMELGILLAWGPHASALDSTLNVSQYPHTAWRVREGFPKSTISSIAQTPDGCLWLGTE